MAAKLQVSTDGTLTFLLQDQSTNRRTLAGRIEIKNGTISIILDGYGTKVMEPGHGDVIYVELYEGTPKLHVWADINAEDATHSVDLSGASEERRVDG